MKVLVGLKYLHVHMLRAAKEIWSRCEYFGHKAKTNLIQRSLHSISWCVGGGSWLQPTPHHTRGKLWVKPRSGVAFFGGRGWLRLNFKVFLKYLRCLRNFPNLLRCSWSFVILFEALKSPKKVRACRCFFGGRNTLRASVTTQEGLLRIPSRLH